MNKVGIYFAYWTKEWNADYRYYIEKVSELGFDVLELCTAPMLDMPKSELVELKKLAESRGIELTFNVGFPKDRDMSSEDPTVRKNGIEYARKTLEAIYHAGGKVFGGVNYSYWPGSIDEGIVDKRPYLERSIKCMKEVAKMAEEYDVNYCLEIVNRFEQFLLNTASEGVAFVNEIDSPKVNILLDSFHMNIEEDNIGEAIIFAGDRLGHFHIGECNRKVPGKGHMPWDEIMSALDKIDYRGRIVMEPFVKMGGIVGRDIRVWRDLSNGADGEQLDLDAKGALEFVRSKFIR